MKPFVLRSLKALESRAHCSVAMFFILDGVHCARYLSSLYTCLSLEHGASRSIASNDSVSLVHQVAASEQLVVILDFESIVSSISPETGLRVNDIDTMEERSRSDSPILIAEDSPLLSKLITECLRKAGYDKLIVTQNGQEAWNKLCELKNAGTVRDKVHCIITDIEMPQMDGHRLTKLVKTDPELKPIPLIIFSSLVNEEMKRKGEQLGANAQLTKPEIGHLVDAIDQLIGQAQG